MRCAVGVLVGMLGACAHRVATPTCGTGWSTLGDDHGHRIAWTAPDPATTIGAVEVAGVEPALRSTLAAVLGTKRGQRLGLAPLQQDLRTLWGLGVISDAQVELAGDVVTFSVTPRPQIGRVVFAGAHIKRFALLPGTPFEPARLRRIAQMVELGYIREGHLDAQIRVEQAHVSGATDVCVAARPGPRVTISAVRFPGHHRISAAVLRDTIHGDHGGVNHVGGTYDADALSSDQVFLSSAYYDAGSVDVQVGTPRLIRHGPHLEVEIPIHEGPLYHLGAITSPAVLPRGVRPGDVFSRTKISAVREQLAKRLHADVEISTHVDRQRHRIDLAFDVHWRWPWDAWRPWLVPSR